MADSGVQHAGDSDGDALAEARSDTVGVLMIARRWRLPPARWHVVESALIAIDEAVADGDASRLRRAIANLVVVGPLRVTRIGDVPDEDPPEPVSYKMNSLIHSLGEPLADQEDADQEDKVTAPRRDDDADRPGAR